MKTAMQELMDKVRFIQEQESYTRDNKIQRALKRVLLEAHFLIEKEKEQIKHAYFSGTDFDSINGLDYYDSTFGDNHEAGI